MCERTRSTVRSSCTARSSYGSWRQATRKNSERMIIAAHIRTFKSTRAGLDWTGLDWTGLDWTNLQET